MRHSQLHPSSPAQILPCCVCRARFVCMHIESERSCCAASNTEQDDATCIASISSAPLRRRTLLHRIACVTEVEAGSKKLAKLSDQQENTNCELYSMAGLIASIFGGGAARKLLCKSGDGRLHAVHGVRVRRAAKRNQSSSNHPILDRYRNARHSLIRECLLMLDMLCRLLSCPSCLIVLACYPLVMVLWKMIRNVRLFCSIKNPRV
jgi:hypothetical protein